MSDTTTEKIEIPEAVLQAKNRPEKTSIQIRGGSFMVFNSVHQYYLSGKSTYQKEIIGEIKLQDEEYVFIPNARYQAELDDQYFGTKEFGASYLLSEVGLPYYENLKLFFDPKTAQQLFLIAILKIIDPDVRFDCFDYDYQHSFLSNQYPKVPLQKEVLWTDFDNISTMIEPINAYCQKNPSQSNDLIVVTSFCTDYYETVPDESTNPMGKKFHFDPIFAVINYHKLNLLSLKKLSQEEISAQAYVDFIKELAYKNCVVVADFIRYNDANATIFEENKINYLLSVDQHSKLIKDHFDYNFSGGTFAYQGYIIEFDIIKLSETRWIYCYKSEVKILQDARNYYEGRWDYDDVEFDEENPNANYKEHEKKFGTIFIVSRSEQNIQDIYHQYHSTDPVQFSQGLLDQVLKYDTLNPKENYVLPNTLINFLAIQIYQAFVHFIRESDYEKKKQSYRDIINELKYIMIKPDRDGVWSFENQDSYEAQKYEKLGVLSCVHTSIKAEKTFRMILQENERQRMERKRLSEERKKEKARLKALEKANKKKN
jgi:hypothetical protein